MSPHGTKPKSRRVARTSAAEGKADLALSFVYNRSLTPCGHPMVMARATGSRYRAAQRYTCFGGCDLPMNLPPNANARVPNVIKNPTCREMRETLPKDPEVFKYKIHKLRARRKINGSEPRTNCSPPVG